MRAAQSDLNDRTRQAASKTAAQDTTQLVKLPKLKMIKFGGKAFKWNHFLAQYEPAVHLRPNMSKRQKFNYLLASLTGKAAAATEGL